MDAALAAECAAEQGRFEQYYYLLFANYSKLAKRKWRDYAKDAGVVDLAAFERCTESAKYAAHIDADTAIARIVGVNGTPTWVVGDSVFGGVPSMAQLKDWVQRASKGLTAQQTSSSR